MFGKVAKKPSGQQVGTLDLYFDREGTDKVCDLLLTKGLFLSHTPSGSSVTPASGHVTTPLSSSLSRLGSLLKKSENKHDENGIPVPSAPQVFNGVQVSMGDCERNHFMPPLEKCSLKDDDLSWSNESDEGCHSNSCYQGNKSTTTSSLTESNLTDDDDW